MADDTVNTMEDSVNVTSPLGEIGSLPKAQAQEAIGSGQYKIASPDEVQQAKLQDQYGGIAGPIFAATLGGARTATLGLSDIGLQKLPDGVGFSKDELKGFAEANPKSTLLGEAGGLLRDPLGLAGGITKVAKGTTKGIGAALGAANIAMDESRATAVLTSAMTHGVEGAMLGGIQGTANDYALGDPSLNGEKLMSNIGYGYVFGSAAGSSLKLLGYGLTPAIKKGLNAIENIKNDLIGSGYGDKALISKVLPQRLSEAITDRQLNLDTKGQASNLRRMTVNLNDLTDSVHEEVENFGKEINDDAYHALINGSSKIRGDAQNEAAQFLNETVDKLALAVPEGDRELKSIKSKFKSDAFKTGGASGAILNGLKRLDAIVDKMSSAWNAPEDLTSLGYPRGENLDRMDKVIQSELARKAEQSSSGPPLEQMKGPSEPSFSSENLKSKVKDNRSHFEKVDDFIGKGSSVDPVISQPAEVSAPAPNQGSALGNLFGSIKDSINRFIKGPEAFGPTAAARSLHEEDVREFQKYVSPDPKKLTPFQKTFGKVEDGKWGFDINKMHEALSHPDVATRQSNLKAIDAFYQKAGDMPGSLESARKSIPNSSWKSDTLSKIVENSKKTSDEAYSDYLAGINKRRPLYGWKDYAPVLIAKWHPVVAAAIEAYDWYQDPVHAMHGLSLIERMLGQSTNKSLQLIDDIFSTPGTKTRALIEESKKNLISQKDSENDNIKMYANNPSALVDKLDKHMKDLGDAAPNIYQQLHLAAGNAVAFLHSKMPQTTDPSSPFAEPMKPSSTESYQFDRYRKLVEDPMLSLRQIKDRTITSEATETLMNVYPQLYQELKQNILQKAFESKEKGKEIPYQTKQAISIFLGQTLDSSLSPQSILANQMIFALPQNNPQAAKSSSKPMGASKRMANDYSSIED